MSVDLIIARYNEDLDWLENYQNYEFANVYIYNKSDNSLECPSFLKNCKVIQLPNVGVCDHTYLYHIIHNYNNFSDYNIFIPGSTYTNPRKKNKFDIILDYIFEKKIPIMSGNILHGEEVHKYFHDFTLDYWKPTDEANIEHKSDLRKSPIQPFGDLCKSYFPKENKGSYVGIFGGMRDRIHEHKKEVNKKMHDLTLDYWAPSDNREHNSDFNLTKSSIRPFGDWYNFYFPKESSNKVSYIGMFGVTREMILEHKKDKYIELIETVEKDKFPEAAHYVERVWGTLYKNTEMEESFANNNRITDIIIGINIFYLGVVYLMYKSYKS